MIPSNISLIYKNFEAKEFIHKADKQVLKFLNYMISFITIKNTIIKIITNRLQLIHEKEFDYFWGKFLSFFSHKSYYWNYQSYLSLFLHFLINIIFHKKIKNLNNVVPQFINNILVKFWSQYFINQKIIIIYLNRQYITTFCTRQSESKI